MIESEYKAQIDTIITRLREEREKAHFSQMELSLAAGLSQNQVSSIETGRCIPNLYTLVKLCAALNIRPSILFEPNDKERTQAAETIIALVHKYL